MARPGEVIENPGMGGRWVFLRTANETDGELLEFDFFLRPHGTIAREHRHLEQEERFVVIKGRVRGRIDGVEHVASEGDVIATPPGVRHGWWNDTEEEAQLRVEFRPALKTETFFETVCGLARDGKVNDQGIPNLLQLAVILQAHRGEFHPAIMPVPMLNALITILAPIGRLLGYRTDHPEYVQEAVRTSSGPASRVAGASREGETR